MQEARKILCRSTQKNIAPLHLEISASPWYCISIKFRLQRAAEKESNVMPGPKGSKNKKTVSVSIQENVECIRASTVSQNSVLNPPFLPSHNAFIWCESARAIVELAISNTTGEFSVAESYHLNPPSIYIDVMLITRIWEYMALKRSGLVLVNSDKIGIEI